MKNYKMLFLISLITLLFNQTLLAQRNYIRTQIKKDIEKKTVAPQQEKGVKAIEDITYENDTRYKDYKNSNPLSVEYVTLTYDKKGGLKKTSKEKYVFGKVGECMVMNLGDKDESWMIYNYKDKANYMVMLKDKSAMKMPLVNVQKMVEKQMEKQKAEKIIWEKTNETKTINNYACQKYICKNEDGTYVEVWSTKNAVVQYPANYLLGMQMQKISTIASKQQDIPTGTIIDMLFYDKNNKIQYQRTLQKINKNAEEQYFDMSPFKINDVIDALR